MKNGTCESGQSPELQQSDKRYLFFGVTSIVIWCWSGVCFRIGADLMGSSLVYLTFMCGGGAMVAVIIQLVRCQPLSALYRLPKKVFIAGFFGVNIYTLLLAVSIGIAPIADLGQVNLLNYMWPVWLIILGIVMLNSRPKLSLAVSGLLLGIIGIVISRGFDGVSHLPSDLLPHSMALLGGFLWALYLVLLRKWKIPEEKGGTAFHFATCALLAALLAAYMNEWNAMPTWTPSIVFWVVAGAVGPVGIAYSFYEISIKKGPVLLLASLSYFIPIGSSLVIGLIFEETMNSGLITGAVLITIGAWLIRRAEQG
jgi:drug/metabolite transporter (DMT)-like permease